MNCDDQKTSDVQVITYFIKRKNSDSKNGTGMLHKFA